MEIIRRGKLPEDRRWIGTCASCGTVAQATFDEIDYEKNADCPLCGYSVDFKPESINTEPRQTWT